MDSETTALQDKRETLQNDIEDNFPEILAENNIDVNKSDIEMFDQGSYKYFTTIKNKNAPVDRDVAVLVPIDIKENSDPRKLKEYLKDSLKWGNRTIEIKEPCVRVSYHENDIETLHIDLPLYAQDDNNVYLARGKEYGNASWEEADPKGLNNYLCNHINRHDQLRRVICYLKKWRNEQYVNAESDHSVPPSIGLTLLAIENFIECTSLDGDDDLQALYDTVNNIIGKFKIDFDCNDKLYHTIDVNLPVVPYSDVFNKMKNDTGDYMETFYKRLCKMRDHLDDALSRTRDYDAAIDVRKIFGEDFTLPEKESSKESNMSVKERSFG